MRGQSTTHPYLCLTLPREQCCMLMRKKKICLLLFTLPSLYLLYRIALVKDNFLPLLCPVLQDVYNASTSAPKNIQLQHTTAIDNGCSSGELVYGSYCVFTPYTQKSVADSRASLTLSTQGTVEFLHHVAVLCNRWSGPISVAVYCPGEDYFDARRLVDALRNCDICILHHVTWHFFYPNRLAPNATDVEFSGDCEYIAKQQGLTKRRSQGPYPINVGRNIARSRTVTQYVFPIDIELYPSVGILPKFERMLRSMNVTEGYHVWVLPVFEVYPKYRAPTIKSVLRTMYAKKQAISFHKYKCDICHRIPNITQWLNHDALSSSEVDETLEALKVWSTFKRNKKYRLQFWEPFFIGTRKDPEFDIRLSWEGKQNKMQIAYEMCLMDYNFHIVSNAFLIHSPGISVYNATKEKFRRKYISENNKWISVIKKELVKKYGQKKNC